MRVIFGSDHGGWHLKQYLLHHMTAMHPTVSWVDQGCAAPTSCDYPDIAHAVVQALTPAASLPPGTPQNSCPVFGVLLCGSGQGMAITANRYPFIRAALCRSTEDVTVACQHNNANILVLGERTTSQTLAQACLDIFLEQCMCTPEFRHLQRIKKINP